MGVQLHAVVATYSHENTHISKAKYLDQLFYNAHLRNCLSPRHYKASIPSKILMICVGIKCCQPTYPTLSGPVCGLLVHWYQVYNKDTKQDYVGLNNAKSAIVFIASSNIKRQTKSHCMTCSVRYRTFHDYIQWRTFVNLLCLQTERIFLAPTIGLSI